MVVIANIILAIGIGVAVKNLWEEQPVLSKIHPGYKPSTFYPIVSKCLHSTFVNLKINSVQHKTMM